MSARVLLIEDKAPNLELMSYLFEAFGHRVRTAVDGEEGLAAVRAETFDVVVCDIHLPKIDGHEVARQIRADPALRHLPLVAVTAQAMIGDREKALAAGFDGYITKPIAPETFVSQVEAFLDPALHAAPRPEPEASQQTPPVPPTKGALLLVVDDNAAERGLMYSLFYPSGYEVQIASNIAAALEIARLHRPTLILCDVNMPGGTGFDLLATIKTDPLLRGLPVVIVTSTATGEANREKALALGAMAFISRPVEPEVLLNIVEKCLAEIQKK